MSTNSPQFDPRTESNLATLTPTAQKQFRVFLSALHDASINAKLISGTRTAAEQNALFNQKPPVTKARAWQSNHNYGIGGDIGIFDAQGRYLEEGSEYAKAGKIGRDLGLEWGGSWVSFKDEPHFQCRTGKSVKELHALVLAHGGTLAASITAIDTLILPLKAIPTVAKPAVPSPAPKSPWQVLVVGKSIGGIFRNDDGDILVPARLFVEAVRGKERAALIGRQKINQTDGWLTLDGHTLKDAHGLEIPAPLINGAAYARVRALCEAFDAHLTVGDVNRVVAVTPE